MVDMVDFLRAHQLNFMLILSSVCGIIGFFVLMSTFMTRKRKIALVLMEWTAMFLLTFDRFAYIYRGDVSRLGYYMVRISNFMVFFMTLFTLNSFNVYLIDLFETDGGLDKTPKRLKINNYLFLAGYVIVIIAHFTGFYYTFDEYNRYQRSDGFLISYIIPVVTLILQMLVIINYRKKVSRMIYISLLLFSVIPLMAAVAQVVMYGLSLINIAIVSMCIVLYLFALKDMNLTVEKAHKKEVEYLNERQESMSRLFKQIGEAVVNGIDTYKTRKQGHSVRVAEYSAEIARRSGMDKEGCRRVFFAGLLHDIGKLGISDEVLHKEDDLTEEDEKILEGHTLMGSQMLSQIEGYDYLSVGSSYHHERYDGSGYPKGLKGEEIPEEARIIAIADAYDNMTSKRSYRGPLPQSRVREEFISGSGIKYDPEFTKAMIRMIDEDQDYQLKEKDERPMSQWRDSIKCDEYRSDVSNGIIIGEKLVKSTFKFLADEGEEFAMPSIILFDSLDGMVYGSEKAIAENNYTEYGEIWFDGHVISTRARNMEARISQEKPVHGQSFRRKSEAGTDYEILAGRYRDHVSITIKGPEQTVEVITALPDSTRYIYMAITGEKCRITDIAVSEMKESYGEGDIPRIAGEILYTDRLESDLKNIQIDGYRTESTEGVEVTDGLRLAFHTMSLPTADLIWHCPYIVLYSSSDGLVTGDDYREFVLVRLDGELAEPDDNTDNKLTVVKNSKFEGWDAWKEKNKKGMECSVSFGVRGSKITVTTENAGVAVNNVTTLDKDHGKVYVSLTGDQCALTDIRVFNSM